MTYNCDIESGPVMAAPLECRMVNQSVQDGEPEYAGWLRLPVFRLGKVDLLGTAHTPREEDTTFCGTTE